MKKVSFKEMRNLTRALSQTVIQLQTRLTALEAVLIETNLVEISSLVSKIVECEDSLEGFKAVEEVQAGDRVRVLCEFPKLKQSQRFKLEAVAKDHTSPLSLLETLLLQGKVGAKMEFEEAGEPRIVTIERISRKVANV